MLWQASDLDMAPCPAKLKAFKGLPIGVSEGLPGVEIIDLLSFFKPLI